MGTSIEEILAEQERNRLATAAINDIDALFRDGGFQTPGGLVFHASIVYGLVCLNDLLQLLSRRNQRIAFSENVIVPGNPGADITDLINRCRNAACHLPSGTRAFPEVGSINFLVMTGRGVAFSGMPAAPECEFDDDIAMFWGDTRLYFRRHFMRAIREAKSAIFGN